MRRAAASPQRASSSDVVTLSGTGYAPGEDITTLPSAGNVMTTQATAAGALFATYTAPVTQPAGVVTLVGTGHSSGQVLTTTVNVVPAPLSQLVSHGPPGSPDALTGNGFGANERVALTVGGQKVGQATANAQGGFTNAIIRVPDNLPFGPPSIATTGISTALSASALFTVTPSLFFPAAVVTPGLPVTLTGAG